MMQRLREQAPISVPEGEDLTSILLHAVELDVSDIHLSVGDPPMYRLHGSVRKTDLPVLDSASLHKMLYDILDDNQRKTLERDRELDFALAFGEFARFRVNCFYTMRGEGAAFRVIPSKIKTLDELKMPSVLKRICEKPRGIVLVTGPTGSGKSTTLAAMVNYMNETREEHILTIEDPIEFVHQHKRCLINQREVGPNTKSFSNALRSALREDPDVILVGELRDLETISLALTAAETGHLVFGTLHTQSAPKTCDRLIDVFPPEQQKLVRIMFAESFQAIVCQTLLAKKSGDGRACAMEIMLGNTATKSLIREGKTHQLPTIIQTNQRMGMQSLDQHLKDLLMRGIVGEKEALSKANNPDWVVRGGEAKLESMHSGSRGGSASGMQRPPMGGGAMPGQGGPPPGPRTSGDETKFPFKPNFPFKPKTK